MTLKSWIAILKIIRGKRASAFPLFISAAYNRVQQCVSHMFRPLPGFFLVPYNVSVLKS